jgi:hypothetical protein
VSLLFSLSCWKETEEYHGHALGLTRDVGHGQRQPSSGSKRTAKRLRRTYGQSIRRKTENFNWNQLSKLRIVRLLTIDWETPKVPIKQKIRRPDLIQLSEVL